MPRTQDKPESKETTKDSKRVSSGIPGLDPLISGGFIPNDIYLITGGTGTGKTLFCCQFILEGLQKGEKAIYFSLEELPEDVLQDAAIFGWDFKKYQTQGNFLIEYHDPFEMVDIATQVREKIKSFGATRVVIDSTSIFGMVFANEHELRKAMYNLIKSLKGTNAVVLMTAEILEDTKALSRYGVEEFVVDGVIVLRYITLGRVSNRTLEIRKMRRTKHNNGIISLEFNKNGLEIMDK